jgi:catechol 2,3-dioxygenase-like lactoylglutathione lyase family enzyme
MTTNETKPRLTFFAPQFLVDDLARSIAYYQRLGITFGEPWDGFYAIGTRDGLEIHLKEAAKSVAERHHRREHEHLDAAAGVEDIEAFYAQCVANGATILKPLAATAWGTKDFYVEDPDGYIIAFGGRPSGRRPTSLHRCSWPRWSSRPGRFGPRAGG